MSSKQRAIAALLDGLEASGGDRVRLLDLVMRARAGQQLAAGSPQLAAPFANESKVRPRLAATSVRLFGLSLFQP